MRNRPILSDQLLNWSDEDDRPNYGIVAPPPPSAAAETAGSRADPEGLPHRAVQALWKTGVPVRCGTWPRPQVLFVHQSDRSTTPDGLCAAGVPRLGSAIPGQPSSRSGNPGRNLRDQPGTPAAPRAAVERRHGYRWPGPGTGMREPRRGRAPRRQYAAGVAPCRRPDRPGGSR